MENSKVAIITGGASGIGLATAKKLAGYGVNVVLADWNDNVEDIATNIGKNVLGIKCDVSSEESVKSLVEETVSKFGHIDYLVANAGIGGGSIVNTSSMYGLVGTTMSFAYSATKGAINQMTRSLALTYARDNIRVNAVAPGYVDTPILSQVPNDMKQAMASQMPIGRLGKDNEIANLIIYLLSEKASFITGAVVPIDGGYTAQ
ncbi:MAG: SDR family oxidoreductase [Tenericutes bacterium]|nr:SDR family oxidoreductase [Mycoplasmatota bacterium]